jgi:hypothetical protein
LHVPDEQQVGPVHPWPPHCPQSAEQPLDGGEVEPEPGDDVVVGVEPPPPPEVLLSLLLMKASACWPYSAP